MDASFFCNKFEPVVGDVDLFFTSYSAFTFQARENEREQERTREKARERRETRGEGKSFTHEEGEDERGGGGEIFGLGISNISLVLE